MKPRRYTIGFLVAWIGLAAFAGRSGPLIAQQIWSPDTQTQFVILRNGTVFSGRLEMGGGQFVIHRGNGSSVKLPQNEVDFLAASVYEAYNKLRSRIAARDVEAHLKLANWCLKYKDPIAAGQQISYLEKIANRPRTISMLQKQLANLNHEVPQPIVESNVRRLPALPQKIGVTTRQLEELKRSLTKQSLQKFNSQVHMRFVNGCAAANCHGHSDAPMRMWRTNARGGLNSTAVQRNLFAIMSYVDRDNPTSSPILNYVVQAHGGAELPAYDADSFHFFAIRDWIITTHAQAKGFSAKNQLDTDLDQPIKRMTFLQDASPAPAKNASVPSPVDLNRPREMFQPQDEFDPEIFNRKYSKRPVETSREPNPVSPARPESKKTSRLPAPRTATKNKTRWLPPPDDQ